MEGAAAPFLAAGLLQRLLEVPELQPDTFRGSQHNCTNTPRSPDLVASAVSAMCPSAGRRVRKRSLI